MFYDNLFIGFYNLNKRLLPKSEQPVLNSLFIVSILLFCNILSALVIFGIATNIDVLEAVTVERVVILILFAIGLHALLFYFAGRYKKIIANTKSMKNERISISYLVASALIFITTILYLLASSKIK